MEEFYEELPDNCPLGEAEPANGTFFRLIEAENPTNQDFLSQRALNPNAQYNACECLARAVSIFSDLTDADNLRKIPRHRGKKIVSIQLDPQAGLMKRTGKAPSHHSWWRFKDFNILQASSLIGDPS